MNALVLISTLVFSASVFAQNVDVNGINAGQEGSTTIEIKKNKPTEEKKDQPVWEVQDGTADVEGDSAATAKEAKTTWKTACDKWKKEFRDDNKENKIVSMNCGSASCGGEVGQKVCTSKATYKIKTKTN
jgi:hypothetical protein